VRPQANYQRSLDVLQYVKKNAPQIVTKSGIMVGLGESPAQVAATLADLRSVGCDSLTVGQYLAPSPEHIPVAEYIVPEQFQSYQQLAKQLGFSHAACGPLVRSSYHASEGFFLRK
jgi:lipoic acid synthetase